MKYLIDTDGLQEYTDPYRFNFTGAILPNYHFTWEEVQAGDGKKYITQDLLEKYRDNAFLLAIMMEEFREWLGSSITPSCWLRETYYNNVILPKNGYASSKTSDHLEARAMDTDVKPTNERIAKWKDICHRHNVYWSIGLYANWMHMGFRFDNDHSYDYR